MKSIAIAILFCTGCATTPTSSIRDAAKACSTGGVLGYEHRSDSGVLRFYCARH